MTDQTASYITLKPIAEQFKRVANNISDKDIKLLIMGELQRQIRNQVDFGYDIAQIVDTWVDENTEFVENCIRTCIKEKFKN